MPGTKGRSGGDHTSKGTDPFPIDDGPQPPQNITEDEKAVWDALLCQLPAELLRGVDVYMLATLCRCICDAEKCHSLWRESSDPKYLRLVRTTEAQISKLSALYGLSPADRGRLKFETEIEDDATEWETS